MNIKSKIFKFAVQTYEILFATQTKQLLFYILGMKNIFNGCRESSFSYIAPLAEDLGMETAYVLCTSVYNEEFVDNSDIVNWFE